MYLFLKFTYSLEIYIWIFFKLRLICMLIYNFNVFVSKSIKGTFLCFDKNIKNIILEIKIMKIIISSFSSFFSNILWIIITYFSLFFLLYYVSMCVFILLRKKQNYIKRSQNIFIINLFKKFFIKFFLISLF